MKKWPMSNNLKKEADHLMHLTSILIVLEEEEMTFQISKWLFRSIYVPNFILKLCCCCCYLFIFIMYF